MTIRTRTRVLSRRNTLLGSATMASLPLSMPFISKAGAADPRQLGHQLAVLSEGAAALATSLDDPTPWAWAKTAAAALIDQALAR